MSRYSHNSTIGCMHGIHPLALYATYLVKALNPPIKFAVVLSSYGWGGAAIWHVQQILRPSKIEVVGAMEVNGPLSINDIKHIAELGKTLAAKIPKEG